MVRFMKNYKDEVKEIWGETPAYKEYSEKSKGYNEEKYEALAEDMNDIFAEFATCMKSGEKTDSDEAQKLAEKLQSYITEHYYTCTKEILSGLGQMYISDERFRNNIDKHAEGTAEFAGKAIEAFCR